MSYDRSDLVVLMYSENNCYTIVVLTDDPRVEKSRATIDEKSDTWTAPHPGDPALAPQTQKIGEDRYFDRGSRWGVIGVYDRTKLEHLNSMIRDSQEATDDTSSFLED